MNTFADFVPMFAADREDSKATFHFPFPLFHPFARAHIVPMPLRKGVLSYYLSLKNIPQPQKARHKGELRICPHFCRRAIAEDFTVKQNQHSICNRKGFLLVVG